MSKIKHHDLPDDVTQQNPEQVPDSASTLHSRRRRKKLSRTQLKRRKMKQFLIGSLPFMLVLASLVLISIGVARYIEQESVISIFLTRRDARPVYAFDGDDWSDFINQTQVPPTEGETQPVPTPQAEQERLRVPFYYIGDQVGVMRIPSVDIDVAVLQGDREAEFRLGAGHYPGSLFPGQGGNILIGAHRTSYFRNLVVVAALVDREIYPYEEELGEYQPESEAG